MKTHRLTARLVTVAVLAGAVTVVVQPGFAAFPGTDGRIAFTSDRDSNDEI